MSSSNDAGAILRVFLILGLFQGGLQERNDLSDTRLSQGRGLGLDLDLEVRLVRLLNVLPYFRFVFTRVLSSKIFEQVQKIKNKQTHYGCILAISYQFQGALSSISVMLKINVIHTQSGPEPRRAREAYPPNRHACPPYQQAYSFQESGFCA